MLMFLRLLKSLLYFFLEEPSLQTFLEKTVSDHVTVSWVVADWAPLFPRGQNGRRQPSWVRSSCHLWSFIVNSLRVFGLPLCFGCQTLLLRQESDHPVPTAADWVGMKHHEVSLIAVNIGRMNNPIKKENSYNKINKWRQVYITWKKDSLMRGNPLTRKETVLCFQFSSGEQDHIHTESKWKRFFWVIYRLKC